VLAAGVAMLLQVSLGADPAALDDEIWIEKYMNPDGQGSSVPRGRGRDEIPVRDLPRFVGSTVRIKLINGREREGLIEGYSDGRLVLRSRMGGGYARYDIALDQIVSSEQR
jgi:hypothetical protein